MIAEGVVIIDQIIEKMFGRYRDEFRRTIESLCDRMGRDEQGNPSIGFIYNGKWIPRPLAKQVIWKNWSRPGLPYHLLPEMDKAAKEQDVMDNDRKQINQLLVKLIYQCNDVAEIRDALPDCLWIYAGFSSHQRMFNQEHFFWNDKRVAADMHRLLPRIEFYLGMSLIL